MPALRRVRLLLVAMVMATGSLGAVDIEEEARVIEDLLMAPCCFQQQVSVHQSPTATAVKKDIRARLARGESRDVILAAYVQEHGAGILVVPPAQGTNLILYVLPPIVLAASILLVVGLIRRFSLHGPMPAPQVAATPGSNPAMDARLTDELRDLD